MGYYGSNIHISKDEMKRLFGIFENCAEEAKKAGEAVYLMDQILSGYVYKGSASESLSETTGYMYSGLLRLQYLYEELGRFIDTTTESFMNVDGSAEDAANEVIVTEQNSGDN